MNYLADKFWELVVSGPQGTPTEAQCIVVGKLVSPLVRRGYPLEKVIQTLSGHTVGGMVTWRALSGQKYTIRSLYDGIAAVLRESIKAGCPKKPKWWKTWLQRKKDVSEPV
jgi:hypothetical protein